MARIDGEAFLFYFERWRGSRAVQRMSMAERGVFLEMMIEQWLRTTLPDDPRAVAEAIASTDVQIAEIEAAWVAVRRKFVSVERKPGQIMNLQLDKIRQERRVWVKEKKRAGREGGLRAARNRLTAREIGATENPSTTIGDSSGPVAKTTDQNGVEGKGVDQKGREQREIPRAHHGTVFEGALPREHLRHVACDETHGRCVPEAVHAKFVNTLAPKYQGDREKANAVLRAWYPTVWQDLPADFVMPDAFRFWQGRFDAKLASADATKKPMFSESLADQTRGVAKMLGIDPTKAGIPS